MPMRARFLWVCCVSVLCSGGTVTSVATAQEATPRDAARPSRVDSSAPLSGGERWVKENGRWRLQRVNYRYLDHADYAPRPAPPPTLDDFPEPRVVLNTRWFGRSGWGYRTTPVWGFGWSPGGSSGWRSGVGVHSGSPWTYGVSPWSPWGYGGWRGVPRYGWGHRGYGGRSHFGFSLGWGGGVGY